MRSSEDLIRALISEAVIDASSRFKRRATVDHAQQTVAAVAKLKRQQAHIESKLQEICDEVDALISSKRFHFACRSCFSLDGWPDDATPLEIISSLNVQAVMNEEAVAFVRLNRKLFESTCTMIMERLKAVEDEASSMSWSIPRRHSTKEALLFNFCKNVQQILG